MKMTKKRKMIIISIALSVILVAIIMILCISLSKKPVVQKETIPEIHVIFKQNLTAEVFSEVMLYDYIDSIQNGTILTENIPINTSALQNVEINISIADLAQHKHDFPLTINIIDTTPPQIDEFNRTITIMQEEEVTLTEYIKTSDNSKNPTSISISGTYDNKIPGTYPLTYIVSDSSGNTTEQVFELIVNKKPIQPEIDKTPAPQKNNYPYYIKINRLQNVVMVYGLDDSNQYTKLEKVFVCSTGKATPLGKYRTEGKYKWRWLFGDVYGQYATIIDGDILFHSVPYTEQSKDTLEYWEYNKLGTKASLGCIRLTVIDAKWIYDNCPSGTMVELYDSDDLNGIEKPTAPVISETNPNKGWDPTDPDIKNPWNQ